MPRMVYAKFRDSTGLQYGPIQDDIVYDPDPPELVGVEIIEPAASAARSMDGVDVIVRVTVSDANSGAGTIQMSHSAGFDAFSEFPVAGSQTDIPWSLQPSGSVYVRVVDRAGNLSEVSHESTRFNIYLPLTLKSGP
jgi:hypothetical protein